MTEMEKRLLAQNKQLEAELFCTQLNSQIAIYELQDDLADLEDEFFCAAAMAAFSLDEAVAKIRELEAKLDNVATINPPEDDGIDYDDDTQFVRSVN